MTLAQLRYLVAIVDAGLNITLAAEHVHATQPGLSKQLRQLEDELGFALFLRRGKSLDSLTPEGAEVVERARVMLGEAANIRILSESLRTDTRGSLVIACTHTQARFVLPQALGRVRRELPELMLRIQPAEREEVVERMARGSADVGLISTSSDEAPPGLALPVYRWDLVAVAPLGHPLAATETATLAQLAAQPLVSYDSTLLPGSSLQKRFAAEGLRPQVGVTAPDADLIKGYVRAGLGVGILAQMAMRAEDAQSLRTLSLRPLFGPCTTWVLLRPDRRLSRPIAAVLAALAPHIDLIALRQWLAGDHAVAIVPERIPSWPPPAWKDSAQWSLAD
ncbi:MAG: LysR substrate-binding domain-containing protein [Lysobacteraceae bacterium]